MHRHRLKLLSQTEKFVYFEFLIRKQNYNVVAGFSLSEQNYDNCIESYKDRYDKVDAIINENVNNLLNMKLVKNYTKLCTFKKLYDMFEVNI